MKNNDEILQSLIAGGLIGAALGALIADKDKQSGAELGALAGAVLFATFKANENAKKVNIPMIVEENNAIYEISPDGTKRFIKEIPKSKIEIPSNFILQ